MDSDKPKEPFKVEVETEGCPACGRDRMWGIVGPDGVQHHTFYGDRDDADEMCDDLTSAYLLGYEDGLERAKNTGRVKEGA